MKGEDIESIRYSGIHQDKARHATISGFER
jgi:hypothetical protein